jgi:hypothetical protein
MTLDRDAAATDALLTDLYLDALLAGASDPAAGHLDPAARRAAERLRHDLVRVHPSFRFEERLATRLAEAAVAMRVRVAVGGEGRVVSFPRIAPAELDPGLLSLAAADRAADAPSDGRAGPRLAPDAPEADVARRVAARPLLIGGALTSAALSIAGAAFVAWRLGRPGRAATPMARAARAVRDARLAEAVDAAVGPAGRAMLRRLD